MSKVGAMVENDVLLWRAVEKEDDNAKGDSMERGWPEIGRMNPKASPELSRFAFLLGLWGCEAKLKSADGAWQHFNVRWAGHYILAGYAIADEYMMTDAKGALVVLGMNFRTYDASKGAWHIKWLNALSGTWTDLVSGNLGQISITDKAIRYSFKEPVADQTYTRATYTNISENHFTWIGEKSNDGQSWAEFMVVECNRSED